MFSKRCWTRIAMGFILCLVILALSLGLALGLGQRHHVNDPIVDLGYTKYKGRSFSDGTSHWLGVRYAAPPVGNLRFAAPKDPPRNDTTQPATKHGPRCIPTRTEAQTYHPLPETRSEDCLFADIYAPSMANPNSKYPVFVFIQGGGFNDNAGTSDGKDLLKTSGLKMVIVTFNYRVGLFGFLASEEVQKFGSLNNGLLDQRMLLHWVQKHIAQFGGDPGHVVLGGASAGAASITLQLVAYGGRDDGLFHATAAESQAFAAIRTVAESQYQYNELADRTKCSSKGKCKEEIFKCLQDLDIVKLHKANIRTKFPGTDQVPIFAYNPCLDNDFIQSYTYDLFNSGKFVKLPAIYGDDTNESSIFVPRSINTAAESKGFIQAQYPAIIPKQLDRLMEIYQLLTPKSSSRYWDITCNAYSEIRYVCPGIHLSDMYARHAVHGIYNYRYNVKDPVAQAAGLGVPHVAEQNAIWGVDVPASYFKNGINGDVVPLMQAYWTSFIVDFDPNPGKFAGSPEWLEWTGMMNKGARLLVQGGANASTMEAVDPGQRQRCEEIADWGVGLKQ